MNKDKIFAEVKNNIKNQTDFMFICTILCLNKFCFNNF